MSAPQPPVEIVHIATPSEWEAAQQTGMIAPPSLATEGFVHCSTVEQVPGTLARYFADVRVLYLLTLDAAAVASDLRWEEIVPGEPPFPHVYASIPVDAVVAVEQIEHVADAWTESGDI
jgi:uncharacterized protein (DUF952 family)